MAKIVMWTRCFPTVTSLFLFLFYHAFKLGREGGLCFNPGPTKFCFVSMSLRFLFSKEIHTYGTACEEYWMKCQLWRIQYQIRSVAQSCPTLCDPMNRSMPGLPVHHQLPEFTQTHVHQVSDAIQLSHPLSSPSPPAPNPSQHQSLFQWVNSLHEVAKVLEFQL